MMLNNYLFYNNLITAHDSFTLDDVVSLEETITNLKQNIVLIKATGKAKKNETKPFFITTGIRMTENGVILAPSPLLYNHFLEKNNSPLDFYSIDATGKQTPIISNIYAHLPSLSYMLIQENKEQKNNDTPILYKIATVNSLDTNSVFNKPKQPKNIQTLGLVEKTTTLQEQEQKYITYPYQLHLHEFKTILFKPFILDAGIDLSNIPIAHVLPNKGLLALSFSSGFSSEEFPVNRLNQNKTFFSIAVPAIDIFINYEANKKFINGVYRN